MNPFDELAGEAGVYRSSLMRVFATLFGLLSGDYYWRLIWNLSGLFYAYVPPSRDWFREFCMYLFGDIKGELVVYWRNTIFLC